MRYSVPLVPITLLFFLGAFSKLQKATVSFVMPAVRLSVRPHETTRPPLYEFSWNFIRDYFSEICLKISSFAKIWQK
jgi:hypothetical protein